MRTGAEYRAALRDGRKVFVMGEGPVDDVTTHPATKAMVEHYADWYDRHFDPDRRGRRTLVDLCAQYGIEIGNAHDASADATASIEVLFALALRYDVLWGCDLARLHHDQIDWHRDWTESYDSWRLAEGMIPSAPRDYVWPVAPAVLPAA